MTRQRWKNWARIELMAIKNTKTHLDKIISAHESWEKNEKWKKKKSFKWVRFGVKAFFCTNLGIGKLRWNFVWCKFRNGRPIFIFQLISARKASTDHSLWSFRHDRRLSETNIKLFFVRLVERMRMKQKKQKKKPKMCFRPKCHCYCAQQKDVDQNKSCMRVLNKMLNL